MGSDNRLEADFISSCTVRGVSLELVLFIKFLSKVSDILKLTLKHQERMLASVGRSPVLCP